MQRLEEERDEEKNKFEPQAPEELPGAQTYAQFKARVRRENLDVWQLGLESQLHPYNDRNKDPIDFQYVIAYGKEQIVSLDGAQAVQLFLRYGDQWDADFRAGLESQFEKIAHLTNLRESLKPKVKGFYLLAGAKPLMDNAQRNYPTLHAELLSVIDYAKQLHAARNNAALLNDFLARKVGTVDKLENLARNLAKVDPKHVKAILEAQIALVEFRHSQMQWIQQLRANPRAHVPDEVRDNPKQMRSWESGLSAYVNLLLGTWKQKYVIRLLNEFEIDLHARTFAVPTRTHLLDPTSGDAERQKRLDLQVPRGGVQRLPPARQVCQSQRRQGQRPLGLRPLGHP